jgi:hypothetical protein
MIRVLAAGIVAGIVVSLIAAAHSGGHIELPAPTESAPAPAQPPSVLAEFVNDLKPLQASENAYTADPTESSMIAMVSAFRTFDAKAAALAPGFPSSVQTLVTAFIGQNEIVADDIESGHDPSSDLALDTEIVDQLTQAVDSAYGAGTM